MTNEGTATTDELWDELRRCLEDEGIPRLGALDALRSRMERMEEGLTHLANYGLHSNDGMAAHVRSVARAVLHDQEAAPKVEPTSNELPKARLSHE